MDDQDRKSQQEHWDELAALLGLGPESSPPRPAARPAHSEPAAPRREPPPPEVPHVPVQHFEEPVQEQIGDIDDEAPLAESEPRGSDEGAGEERGRRGRRRRGRRGGGRKDDSRHKPYKPARNRDEQPELSVASADEKSDEDQAAALAEAAGALEPADDEPADDRAALEYDAPAQPRPTDADDDEDDEEDATMDWNVVTWSELIASLKRL